MAGRSVPIVLIPKYTTYAGDGGTFYTPPIPIGAYDTLVATIFGGKVVGPGGSACTLQCQESNDLTTWTDCSGGTPTYPGPFTPVQYSFTLEKGWLRFGVHINNASALVTLSVEGHLELREK
jgi:hypothetical protein